MKQGLILESDVSQIEAVINGAHAGRQSEGKITVFDGTGVGLQDLAVAASIVDARYCQWGSNDGAALGNLRRLKN